MQINKLNVINAYMMHLYGGGGSHTTTFVCSCARVQHYIINAYMLLACRRACKAKGKSLHIYIYSKLQRTSKQHIVRMNEITYTQHMAYYTYSSNTQTTRVSVFGRVAKNFEVATILAYSIQFVCNDYLKCGISSDFIITIFYFNKGK